MERGAKRRAPLNLHHAIGRKLQASSFGRASVSRTECSRFESGAVNNTSYHSRGGISFNTQTDGSHKHRKIALPQTRPPLSTRVELFSRCNRRLQFQFALRNRPGVTSIHVGSNPASPTKRGSSQMVKASVNETDIHTSLHSRNAHFTPRNRTEVTSETEGCRFESCLARQYGRVAKLEKAAV